MPFGLEDLLSLFGGSADAFGDLAATDFIDPELVTLAANDPTMAFELADLGNIPLEELGFGVGENASDFGLTPGSTETVGETGNRLGSRLLDLWNSGRLANTAGDVATNLARLGLNAAGSSGGFRLPDIRLEESPQLPSIPALSAPKTETANYPTPPEPSAFRPLTMNALPGAAAPAGLERLMARDRAAGEYLPESMQRLAMNRFARGRR